MARLTPKQRCQLVDQLADLTVRADPIRRVYIPKPNQPDEKRPLGIPTLRDRAYQALVKLALEPEWEAQFEPNSYAFRPGRGVQDAVQAIFQTIALLPKYVLETDIEKCFDRIAHEPLLKKLNSTRTITRLVRNWLKAGILDGEAMLFPEAGTPQGGVLSPLLANIALHGLEHALVSAVRPHKGQWRSQTQVIRYADDLVVLHPNLEALLECKRQMAAWLAPMGLQLKASKTQVTHTLHPYEGRVGFDFLGFTIRQFWVGKHRKKAFRNQPAFKTLTRPSQMAQKRHQKKLKAILRRYRSAPQAALIAGLNPIIRGWRQYYATSAASRIFSRLDHQLTQKLLRWANYRHPKKPGGWCYRRYWRTMKGRQTFGDGQIHLVAHAQIPIRRHVKVKGAKSPYDGDWVYWGARLGRYPAQSKQVSELLKQQQGKCARCGLYLTDSDRMETHHRNQDKRDNRRDNLWLVHGHCHDQLHQKQCR